MDSSTPHNGERHYPSSWPVEEDDLMKALLARNYGPPDTFRIERLPIPEPGYVRHLGATDVIDYLATDVVEETLDRHPGGVDAIVNLALQGEALIQASRALRPGGRLLSTTPGTPEPTTFARDDITVTVVMDTTSVPPGTFPAIAARALDGTLPDSISRRYRFDGAGQAYKDLAPAKHTRGKFVVSADPARHAHGSS
jgi:NADPH:quinone reductase